MHVPPRTGASATSVDDVLVMGGTTCPLQPSESRGRTTCCGTRTRPSPLTPTVGRTPWSPLGGSTDPSRPGRGEPMPYWTNECAGADRVKS